MWRLNKKRKEAIRWVRTIKTLIYCEWFIVCHVYENQKNKIKITLRSYRYYYARIRFCFVWPVWCKAKAMCESDRIPSTNSADRDECLGSNTIYRMQLKKKSVKKRKKEEEKSDRTRNRKKSCARVLSHTYSARPRAHMLTHCLRGMFHSFWFSCFIDAVSCILIFCCFVVYYFYFVVCSASRFPSIRRFINKKRFYCLQSSVGKSLTV